MGYSQDLESQPAGFIAEDDDSDEDVGKTTSELNNLGLDYDSDEKDENEAARPQNELIDLGGAPADNRLRAAPNIPKLSGPN